MIIHVLTKLGKATKPLRLPSKAPACFPGQYEWNIYKLISEYSAGDGFTYCSDCTPEHKEAMVEQRRCAFPGTTFRSNNGVIVGRRAR